MVPVSCGESISTPFARVAQELTGIHFKFLSCPHLVHRIPPVIRTSQRLSTALCTATPQVTRRNSENTSDDRHHNHSVFSRRPSVNPEFPPRPCRPAQPAPPRAPPKRPPLPQPRRPREPHPQLARARPRPSPSRPHLGRSRYAKPRPASP